MIETLLFDAVPMVTTTAACGGLTYALHARKKRIHAKWDAEREIERREAISPLERRLYDEARKELDDLYPDPVAADDKLLAQYEQLERDGSMVAKIVPKTGPHPLTDVHQVGVERTPISERGLYPGSVATKNSLGGLYQEIAGTYGVPAHLSGAEMEYIRAQDELDSQRQKDLLLYEARLKQEKQRREQYSSLSTPDTDVIGPAKGIPRAYQCKCHHCGTGFTASETDLPTVQHCGCSCVPPTWDRMCPVHSSASARVAPMSVLDIDRRQELGLTNMLVKCGACYQKFMVTIKDELARRAQGVSLHEMLVCVCPNCDARSDRALAPQAGGRTITSKHDPYAAHMQAMKQSSSGMWYQ